MTGKTTVVTSQRFAQGLSYEEYLAQIKVNKLRFCNTTTSLTWTMESLKGSALLPNAAEAPPRCWQWAKTGAPTFIEDCLPWPS